MADSLSADYFEQLSRCAGIGIVATDEHLVVRFCNASACELLGRPSDALPGQNVIGIVPSERQEVARRVLDRVAETGHPLDFEMRYPRPDGRLVQLAVTISAVRRDTQMLGIAVFFRDMSRQLELLRDMAQAQKMAALESVAGAVAHHYNNILGGAITTADFALASDDPDMHKRTLGIAITALSRASEVTRGLLAFAEGEHTDSVSVDVRRTVERYVSGLESTLASRSIRLEADLQPISAALPPKGLTAVLDRLIANAVEVMPTGGTLTVHLRPAEGRQLLLRIGDTGPGISEEILPRIFEPFFTTKQSDRARTGVHTGLGLAIVHGIVKDLGGTITVNSTPTAGTTFTILLPANPPPDVH